MATAGEIEALEKLLRPLSQQMTRELASALVSIRADQETQARYDELAEKQGQGSITAPELAELEGMVRANTFLGILKTQAHLILNPDKQ